VARMLRMCDN